MGALALLLLVAGVWTSWNTAQYAMLVEARERGTMTVTACHEDRCTARTCLWRAVGAGPRCR